MTDCLFIGGTADGEKLPVEDETAPYLYRHIPLTEVHDDRTFGELAVKYEAYWPQKISAEGQTFVVYAHSGLTMAELLEKLEAGNKPKRRCECKRHFCSDGPLDNSSYCAYCFCWAHDLIDGARICVSEGPEPNR